MKSCREKRQWPSQEVEVCLIERVKEEVEVEIESIDSRGHWKATCVRYSLNIMNINRLDSLDIHVV